MAQRLGKRRRRQNRRGMGRTLLCQIKENLRALLQIGMLKERKRRETIALGKAQTKFRKQGPRSLRPQLGEKKGDMDLAGVEEIGEFWRGIWEERGQYDLRHPALERWKEKEKERGTEDRPEAPHVGRDSKWHLEVKGMACWKAPGPDKIHGFRHKAFPQTNSLLKNRMWKIWTELTKCQTGWSGAGQ